MSKSTRWKNLNLGFRGFQFQPNDNCLSIGDSRQLELLVSVDLCTSDTPSNSWIQRHWWKNLTLIVRGVNFDHSTTIPEFEMEAEYGNNEYPGVSVVFLSSKTATNGESKVIVKRTSTLIFGGCYFYLVTMVSKFKMAAKNKNHGRGNVSEFWLGGFLWFRWKKLTFCCVEVTNSNLFSVIQVKSSVLLNYCSQFWEWMHSYKNEANAYLSN